MGLGGVVLGSCWAADGLPGRSFGYSGCHHCCPLRSWDGPVLPVKLDTTLPSLEIRMCVSVLGIQPSFLAVSPCC